MRNVQGDPGGFVSSPAAVGWLIATVGAAAESGGSWV